MIATLALLVAQAAAAAPRGIEPARPPVVEAYQGVEVTQALVLTNRGERPFRVLAIEPDSPGAFVDAVPAQPIPPGGSVEVTLRLDTSGRLGLGGFRYVLRADDGLPDRRLVVNAFVQSAYEPDRPLLAGAPAPGSVAETRIASRLVPRLAVDDVSGTPGFLTVAALPGPEGTVLLRATVAKDAPLGLQRGTLRVRTNVAAQPELALPYELAIFEDVQPEAPSLDLGTVRQGQPFARKMSLRSRSGRPFEVASVTGPEVTATVGACADPAPGCRQLEVTGTGGDPAGGLSGALDLRLRDARGFTIPFTGVLVRADARVRDLGQIGAASPAPAASRPPAPTPPPVPPPVTGKPGERRARLVWTATQEDQIYGYLIYRADRREGPFQRANAKVVLVGSGPGQGSYAYEDDAVEPGRSYFYYLESVDRSGQKRRISGVVEKIIPAAP
jgi:hypothetical protein